ncbi:MAG: cysteine desulfurase-like protein, partial [Pseudomonadota bacterium]
MSFDPESVRPLFPALNQTVNGSKPIFLDGPGGTQVPQSVLDGMTDYLKK